uniref:G-protein coupled receptors family 1 profile domain-containing protein n=1 Tax=Chelydra serpentina TaxID=8475 RepID=A0A8C3XV88_CHESE
MGALNIHIIRHSPSPTELTVLADKAEKGREGKQRIDPKKKMSNQTMVTDFLLLGFSDVRELQILHFVVFLMIYLTGLMGNFLIISAVVIDNHLHTPMYFFLVNLSIIDLDLCYISVPIPKSMVNSLTNSRSISYSGCIIQVFLFPLFAVAELRHAPV